MAPEVAKRTGHAAPADIWSIGCCVIEMLTSMPPWYQYGTDSEVVMDVIRKTQTPPTYPSQISE